MGRRARNHDRPPRQNASLSDAATWPGVRTISPHVLTAILDLVADARTGLPSDHGGTFTAITGMTWPHARAATPGLARYITLLERGYALHELTFALLFVIIILVPFRRGQRWAWWAAWIVMIADLGYSFTFGAHDHAILARSLAVVTALAVLLLAHIPVFFGRSHAADVTDHE